VLILLVLMHFAINKAGLNIFHNVLDSATSSFLWSLLTHHVDINFLVLSTVSHFGHLGIYTDGHKYLSLKKKKGTVIWWYRSPHCMHCMSPRYEFPCKYGTKFFRKKYTKISYVSAVTFIDHKFSIHKWF
jgi:hypothetical protein